MAHGVGHHQTVEVPLCYLAGLATFGHSLCVITICFVCIKAPSTLQKQVGCFNRRVVTLVADKLERHWL